jgi:succinate dehydrogenase / fumarate reductase cytochrome b subunit
VANESSFLAQHEFLIRRLHSLSGLVPVGAYMVVHLLTNASVLGGTEVFQANVDKIHSLGPVLPVVEWVFIFIPLLFHAIVGFVIIQGGIPNTSSYPTQGNIRYTLQRVTGIIAFFFIVAHVANMHPMAEPLKSRISEEYFANFDSHAATTSTAEAIQQSLLVQIVYAVGVVTCVYHLANGLWTMGITWGVWTTPAAQRRADYVCSGFGIVLCFVGLAALAGFLNVDVEKERALEHRLEQNRQFLRGEAQLPTDASHDSIND